MENPYRMWKIDSPVASRVGIALLVGALLLVPFGGARDATAARSGRCSPANNPTRKIVYDED